MFINVVLFGKPQKKDQATRNLRAVPSGGLIRWCLGNWAIMLVVVGGPLFLASYLVTAVLPWKTEHYWTRAVIGPKLQRGLPQTDVNAIDLVPYPCIANIHWGIALVWALLFLL